MTSPIASGSDKLRLAPALSGAVVQGDTYRFTVLTSRLVRMEYSATGNFSDAATQLVVNRDFGEVPEFRVVRGDDKLEIVTEHLHLTHVPSYGFTRNGLNVRLRTSALMSNNSTWYYGDKWGEDKYFPSNLGGTARTLDEADGRIDLIPGLLAVTGITTLDDSQSVLLTEDQWVQARGADAASEDIYVFAYAQDYQAALDDFFTLSGPSPLISRALLGNWWSRYHAYSAQEYLELMDRFEREELPFSVAVIDMDWHWVDIDPALGTGWTGYSWNTDLFPDPEGFLRNLHERGMLTTLNVHPLDGIRRHEDAYPAVCEALGLDPDEGADVPFKVADRDFIKAYLEQVHHPLEEQGVDFWWLDWQQGGVSEIPGLDPLWMLNHIHYLDSGRERDGGARRPLTFSRFADASSHRTPVGFSGDTVTTWESLQFQPEFTATAANLGYYWWSNDIGGHMFGTRDDRLAARWVQLGCYSPINRLHSTNSIFNSKEPWRYSRDARATMDAHLRWRHQLVPYLYTWARRSASEGTGPVRPLYHDHSQIIGAYMERTTFLFGDLVVVPFTHPLDESTHLGQEKVWVPDGVWYDLPTGRRYDAQAAGQGRMLTLNRPLEQLGVLARAGSVIPLAGDISQPAGENPRELVALVVPGASGSFTMEEDDASAFPGEDAVARTEFVLSWPEHDGDAPAVLEVRLSGAASVVPQRRRLRVRLLSGAVESARLVCGDSVHNLEVRAVSGDGFTLAGGVEIDLGELSQEELTAGVRVELVGAQEAPADWKQEVFNLLEPAELPYLAKDLAWGAVERGLSGTALLAEFEALEIPELLRSAIAEVV